MRRHPPGETRSDRLRQFLVGLGVAIIMVCLPTIVWQQYHSIQSQNNHHAATVQQDARITSLEKQVKQDDERNTQLLNETDSLLKQHTTLLQETAALGAEFNDYIAKAGPAITAGQEELLADLQALCARLHMACPSTSAP